MISFPNAKINIGLRVIRKRKDGYHDLETVFYPLQLSDSLEFVRSKKKESFQISGLALSGKSEDNLVWRAYKLLQKEYDLPAIQAHLHKIIPAGAGLGGGSADAVFMLQMLNKAFDLQLSEQKMKDFASMLGSDCPFFLRNRPTFAEGTGNIMSEISCDLSPYFILVVKPSLHVATKEAFSGIVPKIPDTSLRKIIQTPVREWKSLIINDFEPVVFAKYPEIAEIKRQLYDSGAVYAQMSGSGSAVFGIFEEEPRIAVNFADCFCFLQKPLK